MDWVLHQSMKQESILSPLPSPSPPAPPLPPPVNFGNKITPSILLIIVILAIIFFISGILHLLVRYLIRPSNREPDAMANATAFQGELQQLFHLHDAGVDQSFIDTLPVFQYKSIKGLNDPFDCAVCLCEFEADDKLRLLPKCSHAFHLQCIDTWLLSHSTCPLCRGSLFPDLSPARSCSPVVLVLDSGGESSREVASGRRESVSTATVGLVGEDDLASPVDDAAQKQAEIAAKEELDVAVSVTEFAEAKVVPVKLGKFRSVDADGGEGQGTSNGDGNLDQRRCFSMGAYEYVMDETSSLQVTIKPSKKKPALKKPGHRVARSECDCHSRREGFKGFDIPTSVELKYDSYGNSTTSATLHKKESFSISKIWLRTRKDEPVSEDTSRRTVSFRLPVSGGRDEVKLKKSASPLAVSEFSDSRWCKRGGEFNSDVEAGSCNNGVVSRVDETPSFARTLLWIVGR
ncbi:RING-H2 finger protein ATL13 [Canna indica]|uniref:RING-type E3 ubiquitin transferase n=1 Tax=Canna indica TaxID=4628 RepID=A0AAQ3JR94_9LILI|nr:RING-H2 finger protein ATL13 [Canna indica]